METKHAVHPMDTSSDIPTRDYQPHSWNLGKPATTSNRQDLDESEWKDQWEYYCTGDTCGSIALFCTCMFCLGSTAAFLLSAGGFIYGAYYSDAVEDICMFNNVTLYSDCTYYEDCDDDNCVVVPRSCSGTEAMYCYDTLNGTCDNSEYCQIATFSACYCDSRLPENDWYPYAVNGTPPSVPSNEVRTCWIKECGDSSLSGGDWSPIHADEYTDFGVETLPVFIGLMITMCLCCYCGCRNKSGCCLNNHLNK